MSSLILKESLTLRLSPSLAEEIGTDMSVMLLQLDYWVNTLGQKFEGEYWVKLTIRDITKTFTHLSRSTVSRIILKLEKRNLIKRTQKFNKSWTDSGHWYTIDPVGIYKLESIRPLSQDPVKNETPSLINKINTVKDARPQARQAEEPVSEEVDRAIDQWFSGMESQPYLLSSLAPKEKTFRADPISNTYQHTMYRLCYGTETDQEQQLLSSAQRGKVADALGQLQDARANLALLNMFEEWWKKNWRSRDKATGQYQFPRPSQVTEFWYEAVKHHKAQKKEEPKVDNVVDIYAMMRKRAEEREKRLAERSK